MCLTFFMIECSCRAFNKSQWLAKFSGYISLLLFFGNYPSLNAVFMCCHRVKKPKFNDVCVLFKHSNFCSRMLEMHSKRPRFPNFSRNLCLWRSQVPLLQVFSLSTYSKAFTSYLKSYWKPWTLCTCTFVWLLIILVYAATWFYPRFIFYFLHFSLFILQIIYTTIYQNKEKQNLNQRCRCWVNYTKTSICLNLIVLTLWQPFTCTLNKMYIMSTCIL